MDDRRGVQPGRAAWSQGWVVMLMAGAALAGQAKRAPDRSLDMLMERADAWRLEDKDKACLAVGRVTISVDDRQTHGTPRSLRMDFKRDLGKLNGSGIHTMPIAPMCAVRLPDDIDLSQYTRLTFWAKSAGTRHGGLYLAMCSHPAMWGRGLTRALGHGPLDAGPWSRYLLTFGDYSTEDRKKLRWFVVGSANMGHFPDEEPVMRVWLDDFTLTSKPLRKTEGWDADPTVVIVNQAGFRRFHQKLGVVDGKNKAREFVVKAADTGDPASKGRLRFVRSAVGTYKVADFTRLTKPGRYVVEVGGLKSVPFTIGDDAYRPCIELLSDWVFNMRCGCKTGLHPPCHTDDGTLVEYEVKGKSRKEVSRRHIDAVGGWHDAGDVRTYYWYSRWMAHQFLRARECGWRRDRDGDGVDDMLDSALHAIRHLPKTRDPKTGVFLFKTEDYPDHRRGNYWTDGKPNTDDDRHIMRFRQPSQEAGVVAQAAASAGLFARHAGERFRAEADAALKAVLPRWDYWWHPDTGQKRWRKKFPHVWKHGNHVAVWGRGALQLYLARKDPVHLEFARLCATQITSYQKRLFYAGGARPMGGEIMSWHRPAVQRDLPEEFLADMMLELPDSPDYWKWRATLLRGANWWMKPTRHYWRPFSVPHLEVPATYFKDGFVGVPLEVSPNTGTVRHLVPSAHKQLGDTAHAIQRVAQALNDVELERVIRRQVQWAIGHNPFNISWICQFGTDSIDQHFTLAQGRMPGCVSIYGMHHTGVPRCVRQRAGEAWTRVGARLMRAMIAVSEPARVRLTLVAGGQPWRKAVQVNWMVSREVVFQGTPDENGKLPELKLDGGQRYEVWTRGVRVPLSVVSGTSYTRTIDLHRLFMLSADKPKYVMPEQPFTIKLTVQNREHAR